MKYNTNYHIAESALQVYAASKKIINTVYNIQKPSCKPDEYISFINKNGIPDNIPASLRDPDNFTICQNAEAVLKSVFASHTAKTKIWFFILNENYIKPNNTVRKQLFILEQKGINISRATYYREQTAFINAFAEAAGLGNEYTDNKLKTASKEEGRKILI